LIYLKHNDIKVTGKEIIDWEIKRFLKTIPNKLKFINVFSVQRDLFSWSGMKNKLRWGVQI
jgi:hypothetical protein